MIECLVTACVKVKHDASFTALPRSSFSKFMFPGRKECRCDVCLLTEMFSAFIFKLLLQTSSWTLAIIQSVRQGKIVEHKIFWHSFKKCLSKSFEHKIVEWIRLIRVALRKLVFNWGKPKSWRNNPWNCFELWSEFFCVHVRRRKLINALELKADAESKQTKEVRRPFVDVFACHSRPSRAIMFRPLGHRHHRVTKAETFPNWVIDGWMRVSVVNWA